MARLIDADALTELLVKEKYTTEEMECESSAERDWMRGVNRGIRAAIGLVDRAPTVDYIKQGRWIPTGENDDNDNYYFVCSSCRKVDKFSRTVTVDYCWNCGSKMKMEVPYDHH